MFEILLGFMFNYYDRQKSHYYIVFQKLNSHNMMIEFTQISSQGVLSV